MSLTQPAKTSPEPSAQPVATTPPASSRPPSRRGAWLIAGAFLLVIAIGAGAWLSLRPAPTANAPATPKIRIGLSMATLTELRWQKDRDYILARAKQANASVTVLVADQDNDKQSSQIENLISQKVDALIVVANSADAIAPAIEKAHQAGVKVIAYDRLILNSHVDYYVSFDSVQVGTYEAQYVMDGLSKTITKPKVALLGGSPSDNNAALVKQGMLKVLDPLTKAGKATVVFDQFIEGWKPDLGYSAIKKFLDGGGQADAIVAANDGLALGAIQALQERGLAGKVPVSGQDAELPAVQRLVQGTQTVTVYKPIKSLAAAAVDAAVALTRQKQPKTTGTQNNQLIDVPTYLLNSIAVTKSNIKDTVIKDGFLTSVEIYGKPNE